MGRGIPKYWSVPVEGYLHIYKYGVPLWRCIPICIYKGIHYGCIVTIPMILHASFLFRKGLRSLPAQEHSAFSLQNMQHKDTILYYTILYYALRHCTVLY